MIVLIVLLLLILPATVSGQNPTGPRVDIVPAGTSSGQTGELRFYELRVNGVNYVGIKAADSITANQIWTWPATDGLNGYVLTTDGAGNLTFAAGGGGGGTGCIPTGASGEVLFSDGAGACLDEPNLFWDTASQGLGIGTSALGAPGDASIPTFDLVAGAANALSILITDVTTDATVKNARMTSRPYSNAEQSVTVFGSVNGSSTNLLWLGGGFGSHNAATEITFYTAPNVTTTAGTARFRIDAAGEILIPQNNKGIWMDDSGATARRLLWYDGSNTVHVGTADVTSPAGNIVMQAGDIGVVLERATTNTGTFGPRDGADIIALGSASRPFNSGRVLGGFTLGVTATSVPGTLVFTAISGTTLTMSKANTGSNHGWVLPGANAAGALTNDGAGNLTWVAGGGGGFTCTTANNCVDISGTQTITGQKTLANHLLFNSDNVYSIGQTPGNWANAIFGTTVRGQNVEVSVSGSKTIFWRMNLADVSTYRIWSGSGGQIEVQLSTAGASSSAAGFRGTVYPLSTAGSNGDLGTTSFRWKNLYLSAAADIQGGIITGSSSNSTLYVGTSGNFYNRTLGGASTAVSCAGVANGWTAVSTDSYIVVCRSGARYRAQLVAF